MPTGQLLLYAVLCVLPGLGLLLLARTGRRLTLASPSLPRAASALVATAFASAVGVGLWLPFGVDLFGVINLLFMDVLVVAPLLGGALLLQLVRQRERPTAPAGRRLLLLLAALLLGAGVAGLQARYVEPFKLVLETPTVVAGRLSAPLRIGLLADLQAERVGDHERAAIERLMAERPDLILIAGDLFQPADPLWGEMREFARELPALRALLGRLQAPLGVYAVIGNSDRPNRFSPALEGTSIVWLHNRVTTVHTPAGEIVIGGVSYTGHPAVERTYREVAAAAGPGRLTVVLAHDAGRVYRLDAPMAPDLVVSGHTHGGQIRLPVVGALMTLSSLPRAFAAGLHRMDGTWLYVSRGVGVERGQAPRIRFFCPPEVTLLTVQPIQKRP